MSDQSEEQKVVWRSLRVELWCLWQFLRFIRWRLGPINSWKRTHGISLLANHVFSSQGVLGAMWGWADVSKKDLGVLLHSSSSCSPWFAQPNDTEEDRERKIRTLREVLDQLLPHLGTEVQKQVDLVIKLQERSR